jgi:hypothetical protein
MNLARANLRSFLPFFWRGEIGANLHGFTCAVSVLIEIDCVNHRGVGPGSDLDRAAPDPRLWANTSGRCDCLLRGLPAVVYVVLSVVLNVVRT